MSTSSHIISRFNWDTSFDAKDKAVELQDRLSQWSRIMMPGEIIEVFDKICPPDQTWRIQTLELDLGVVDYANLETELAMKLREQLTQKLVDLIVYMNRNSDNFEILDEDISQVNMLCAFLVNGMMPWNYKPEYGSVNQMLAHQLQFHRQEVIYMLRETGATQENVRKRMAWQFTEPNIVKIIEGFEPNHHGQIIEFSNELTRIQTNALIVQTSTRDFKKNLWHWILNHLLTERGTIFNKVAFMKSSIRQMANHYNISYRELVRLIEEVVNRLPEYYSVKSDFILALKVLSADHYQDLDVSEKTTPEEPFFWESLEMLFSDHTARKRKDGRARFNELVYVLSMKDRERFSTLVFALPKTEEYWMKILDDLNELSMGNFFHALLPAGAGELQEALQLVQELGGKTGSVAGKKQILFSGIRFLHQHRDLPFDNKRFFRYCLAELNKKNPSFSTRVFQQLNGTEIPVGHKSVTAAGRYLDLTTVLYNDLSKTDPAFSARYINTLLEQWQNDSTVAGFKENMLTLPASITQIIRLNPRQTFEVLLEYADKEKLKILLPRFLDLDTASVMARNAKNAACTLVLSLQSFCRKLVRQVPGIPGGMADTILLQGMTSILLHSPHRLQPEKFLEEMLGKIFACITPEKYSELLLFTTQLSNRKIHGFPGLTPELLKNILARFEKSASLSLLKKAEVLVEAGTHNQAELGRLLLEGFADPGFTRSRKNREEKSKILLNYLLVDGVEWMMKLVHEYGVLLAQEIKNITTHKLQNILEEIFWKCILDYRHHRGNVVVFQRQYSAAVMLRFPLQKKILKKKKIASGLRANEINIGWELSEKSPVMSVTGLDNEKVLSLEDLFFYIQQGLSEGKTMVSVAGKQVEFRVLFLSGLERDPAAVRKIMAALPATPKRIENLRSVIGFSEFSAWICSDTYGTVQKTMESLNFLSTMVAYFDTGSVGEELQTLLFKQAWTFIRLKKMSAQMLRQLVGETFTLLQLKAGVNTHFLYAEIRKRNPEMNEALLAAIRHQVPGLKIFTGETKNNLRKKELARYEQTGLLDELCLYLLTQKQVPPWYDGSGQWEPETLLLQLLEEHPARLLAVLKRVQLSETETQWLNRAVGFSALARAIVRLDKNRQAVLRILEKFYAAFTGIQLDLINAKEVQEILFEKLLRSWTTGNQKLVSVENIWHELTWEICVKRKIPRQAFIKEMGRIKFSLPPAIQVSFERLVQEVKEAEKPVKKNLLPVLPTLKLAKKTDSVQLQKSGIAVRNAGLVLINAYIPKLFKLLDLLEEKMFRNPKAQGDAVHYLQYLVTGMQQTEESLLVLNKILCGLPLAHPLEDGIEIPAKQQELMNGLLQATIGHWTSIGTTSLNGFRGNWLVRDGLLVEHEDRWELVVEKRAYDILINKSPFSFSIIRYPWMDKPMHVSWPY